MKYKLYENVLNKEKFDSIKKEISSNQTPWFFNESTSVGLDNHFMFTHYLYRNNSVSSNFYFNLILPITLFASLACQKSNLLRVKANLYTNQNKIINHAKHVDFTDLTNYKTCVFNFTSCNGGTILYVDDEEVNFPSIENSLLVFDGNIEHRGYTQTDKQRRILLNYDFD